MVRFLVTGRDSVEGSLVSVSEMYRTVRDVLDRGEGETGMEEEEEGRG